MGDIRAQTLEAQKKIEPARQPEREPVRQHEQGALQLVASQAAYRRAQVNGNGLTAADLLVMQRTVGNRTALRMLARRVDSANVQKQNALAEEKPGITVQTKLTVGAPDDVHEQEADRVAGQVMTMPDAVTRQLVQREARPKDMEEVQTKPLATSITPLVQLEALPEEVGPVQTSPSPTPVTPRPTSSLESRLNSSEHGGSPLPDEMRELMEPRFGADFSGVRVHADSESAQSNRAVSKQAFTQGQDVFLGDGRSNVDSSDGQRLLAHELTHVVQRTETLRRESKASEKKGSATPAKSDKCDNRELHLTENPLYCCECGKKQRSPTKAKEDYRAKTQGVELSQKYVAEEDKDTEGPKNVVNCRLADEVIEDLRKLLKAASTEGVELKSKVGGRDLAKQWEVWHNAGHPKSTAYVASPGMSNHGTGRAIDFENLTGSFDWLLENAGSYGWVNLPTERWHYDHVSTRGIITKHRKTAESKGTKRKKKMGDKKPKALTPEEKAALQSQYYVATVYVAVPWNQKRAYPRETWLKVQEYVGMPEKERTGAADEATIKAVMAWQKNKGLKSDGRIGPTTLKALGIEVPPRPVGTGKPGQGGRRLATVPAVQRKGIAGQAEDQYEQEADRVASAMPREVEQAPRAGANWEKAQGLPNEVQRQDGVQFDGEMIAKNYGRDAVRLPLAIQRQPASLQKQASKLAQQLQTLIDGATWKAIRERVYPKESAAGIERAKKRHAGTLPELTGLGQIKRLDYFAKQVRDIQAKWNTSSLDERVQKLGQAASAELTAVGVPGFLVVDKMPLEAKGFFDASEWKFVINEALVSAGSLSNDDAAQVTNTTLHESRHAEQWFLAARFSAGVNKKTSSEIVAEQGIPKVIADQAAAKKFDAKTDPSVAALGKQMYQATVTEGPTNQAISDDVNRALADLTQKRAKTQTVLTSLKTAATAQTIADATAARDDLGAQITVVENKYTLYRNIPYEVNAHEVGDAAEQAFRGWP